LLRFEEFDNEIQNFLLEKGVTGNDFIQQEKMDRGMLCPELEV